MTQYSFAHLDSWNQKVLDRAATVVKIAGTAMMTTAQTPKSKGGRLPVDKDILRNSFQSGLNGSTALTGASSYVGALAGFQMGDVFRGGWTAAYAMRREKGFVGTDSLGRTYNEQGDHFASSAWMTWPSEVRKAAASVSS